MTDDDEQDPCAIFEGGTMEECIALLESEEMWNIGELNLLAINVCMRIQWLEREGERTRNKLDAFETRISELER